MDFHGFSMDFHGNITGFMTRKSRQPPAWHWAPASRVPQTRRDPVAGAHNASWMISGWVINISYGYGSIPINTIFSGMNIHLPAILMFTRGTRF